MSEIVSFIQSLDLPAAMYRRGAEQEPLPAYNSVAQAVPVGSQMTEFTKDVPQSIRPGISNGLLLGQLAADKASAKKEPDPLAWFTTFNTVLRGIGWQSTLSELNEQSISHKNISLSQAIIPIVTEIVGAAAAAGSIIISVLKGLETMDQDAPWITVFERRSNKVSANNFGTELRRGRRRRRSELEDGLFFANRGTNGDSGSFLQICVVRRKIKERPISDDLERTHDHAVRVSARAESRPVHRRKYKEYRYLMEMAAGGNWRAAAHA